MAEWKSNNKSGNHEEYELHGPFAASIHHHIYGENGEWFLTCYMLNMSKIKLDTSDIEVAREKATKIIKDYVTDLYNKVKCM